MADVVRNSWLLFTEPLEGGVASPYNDVRGLTTIAFGNLVNSPAAFALLPLVHPDGSPATASEKVAAYHAVHDNPDTARLGWRHAATLTPLRLTREGMVALALEKYDSNTRILATRCPDWDTLPACARMALHSLAWACGAHAHFPRLFTDVNARDFEGAAVEIHMNEYTPEGIHNRGLIPRNVFNKTLMRNAAYVDGAKLDPDTLLWERLLEVTDAETLPALDNPPSEPGPIIHKVPDTVTEAQRRDD